MSEKQISTKCTEKLRSEKIYEIRYMCTILRPNTSKRFAEGNVLRNYRFHDGKEKQLNYHITYHYKSEKLETVFYTETSTAANLGMMWETRRVLDKDDEAYDAVLTVLWDCLAKEMSTFSCCSVPKCEGQQSVALPTFVTNPDNPMDNLKSLKKSEQLVFSASGDSWKEKIKVLFDFTEKRKPKSVEECAQSFVSSFDAFIAICTVRLSVVRNLRQIYYTGSYKTVKGTDTTSLADLNVYDFTGADKPENARTYMYNRYLDLQHHAKELLEMVTEVYRSNMLTTVFYDPKKYIDSFAAHGVDELWQVIIKDIALSLLENSSSPKTFISAIKELQMLEVRCNMVCDTIFVHNEKAVNDILYNPSSLKNLDSLYTKRPSCIL